MRELEKLAPLDKEFGTQGVTTIGVCDSGGGDAWNKMQTFAKARKLTVPIMQDSIEAKAASAATDGPATHVGVTAAAYGVEYYPVTVVIDRSGKVRAAGVKADKIKAVVEKLLGEAQGDKPAAPGAGGDK